MDQQKRLLKLSVTLPMLTSAPCFVLNPLQLNHWAQCTSHLSSFLTSVARTQVTTVTQRCILASISVLFHSVLLYDSFVSVHFTTSLQFIMSLFTCHK